MLYALKYTCEFETGNTTMIVHGIVGFSIDCEQKKITVYYDKTSSMYAMHFYYDGKLTHLTLEQEA